MSLNRKLQTYVHHFLVTVVSHPREEERVACYTEEEKWTEISKQMRKYIVWSNAQGFCIDHR